MYTQEAHKHDACTRYLHAHAGTVQTAILAAFDGPEFQQLDQLSTGILLPAESGMLLLTTSKVGQQMAVAHVTWSHLQICSFLRSCNSLITGKSLVPGTMLVGSQAAIFCLLSCKSLGMPCRLRGAYYNKPLGKWLAFARMLGPSQALEKVHLGGWPTVEAAAAASDRMSICLGVWPLHTVIDNTNKDYDDFMIAAGQKLERLHYARVKGISSTRSQSSTAQADLVNSTYAQSGWA